MPSIAPPQIDETIDIIFIGTGASSTSPQLNCLSKLNESSANLCHTCLRCLSPDGAKNIRGTTAGVFVKTHEDGGKSTLMIDCGKTFLTQAKTHFPRHGIARIDAVLLTHDHADAIQGLDDLRMFTLGGKEAQIQEVVHVYCNRETYKVIELRYPYIVNPPIPSPTAPIAALQFHVFEHGQKIDIAGFNVLPIEVQHGWNREPARSLQNGFGTLTSGPTPYYCSAFELDRKVLWMSDVSHISQAVWDQLKTVDSSDGVYDVVALDCTNMPDVPTHLGLAGFCQVALRLQPKRMLAVQMTHQIDTYGLNALAKMFKGDQPPAEDLEWIEQAIEAIDTVDGLWTRLQQEQPRIEASYEGQRLRVAFGIVKDIHM